MKKNNYIYILIILSVILQCLFYNNTKLNYQYTFAIGITGLDNKLSISPMLMLLLPIFIEVFSFNENISDIINKNGKIYIIRNYSKIRLINKMIVYIITKIAVFTCLQIIIYSLLRGKLEDLSMYTNIRAIILYINIILAIALFEQIIQFYISSVYVVLITSIYIFLGVTIGILTKSLIVKFILFPSLTFGLYNGAVYSMKNYISNLIFVFVLNTFQYLYISFKFQKTDIY